MEISNENCSRIEKYLTDLPAKNSDELLKLLISDEKDNFERLLSEVLNKQGHNLHIILGQVLNIVTSDLGEIDHQSRSSTIKNIINRICTYG